MMGQSDFQVGSYLLELTPGVEGINVQTYAEALVGGCGTGHRRVCGNASCHSGSCGGDGSLDRIECQQRILKRGQFLAITVHEEHLS
jgi:hypothetical protein